MKKNQNILTLIFLCVSFVFLAACSNSSQRQDIVGYHPDYFSNRAIYSYITENKETIYYSNVYDQRRLYAYSKKTHDSEALFPSLVNCADISASENDLFFSAWDIAHTVNDVRNVYHINLEQPDEPELLITNAFSPLITTDIIYFLDDQEPKNIYAYDIKTKETKTLLEGYNCDNINLINNAIYAVSFSTGSIIKLDLPTNAVQELAVDGTPDRLSEYNDILYFYTTGEKQYIYKLNPANDTIERILDFNNGDFFFTNLLASDRYLFFSGSKLVNRRTTGPGLYRYDLRNGQVEIINEDGFSHLFKLGRNLYLFRVAETSLDGAMIKVIDENGIENTEIRLDAN